MHNSASRDAIASRINKYKPTTLTSEQWAKFGPEIRMLVEESSPSGVEDAKSLLVVLSKYASWLQADDPQFSSIAQRLTEPHVEAFVSQLAKCCADKTVANQTGRLRRVMKSANGLPRKGERQTEDREVLPAQSYSESEIASMIATGGEVAEVVRVALETGFGTSSVATEKWKVARRSAAQAGISLSAAKLRRTWIKRLAEQQLCTTELLSQGLTLGELDTCARDRGRVPENELTSAR